MAASIATPIAADAIENLVLMIGQRIASEGSLVVNFRKDFQWLTEKLTLTKAYVKDARQKSTQKDFAVEQWLSKLDDVVFDAEDIVEECAAESLYQPETNKSCAVSRSGLIFKYKIGRRIRDLKARMKSIVADAKELRLFEDLNPSEQQATTSSSGAEKWKKSSIMERNARPVAIQAKVDEIIRLLDDAAHQVIGVVGMGGVGKTFLLQNVYNDPRTKGKFEICIWLSISQTYSLRKLQADLASSLNLRDVIDGRLSVQRSAELIHCGLQERKFLIVLDDVWRATNEDNLIEKLGVPAANTQSKVVVTTRNMAVCRAMNAHSIYSMEVLKKEESWNLFCAYAFQDYLENRPPQYLDELARQVESECGKLPLALKIVGASMADQTLVVQWESKLQQLKTPKKLEDPIQDILQLSYDSLPAHLKLCFSYFAFFEEDEEINVEYVIELWRAEGFIPQGDDGREIGLNYFYQLSNLCLIETWEDEYFRKYCKLHDLVLDLAIHICKENKCAFTLEEGCTKYSPSCTQSLFRQDKSSECRRIFLAKQGITDDDISDSILIFPTVLRTLSLRKNDKVENIPTRLFSKARALRVLDLSDTRICTLPRSIECLKLLRVLNLSYSRIKELPQWFRSLKNLRVLRAECIFIGVPDWVSELECLEHLSIPWAASMPKTTAKLRSLRILNLADAVLSIEENGLLKLEDIGKLTSLEELSIEIHWEAELQRMGEGVLDLLVNMRWLRVFNAVVTGEDSDDLPLFPWNLASMTHLESLWLSRFILSSDNISQFVNLKLLALVQYHCNEYPAVELLPNLISLIVHRNNKCKEARGLFGKCGAFPKLRFLQIDDFPLLEELVVLEEGNTPFLEEFRFTRCKSVGRVEGLERLKSLKTFNFGGSGTAECRERLKEGGEEWNKIKANNPHIQINIY